MSIYILDYIRPLIHKLKKEGGLKTDKARFQLLDSTVAYKGEVDEQGLATGFGKATYSSGNTIEGMFYRGESVGVCTRTSEYCTRVCEQKNNLNHGKGTEYLNGGRIFNVIYENNII